MQFGLLENISLLKVNRLIRLAYGPLALGTLGVGELEEVGPRVIREQFAEHIRKETARWTKVVKDSGVKPQ